MWLSPERCARSFKTNARVAWIEGECFSSCGSCLSAAYFRFARLQGLDGFRALPFQIVALALAPCTLVENIAR
eukprot:3348001-Pyramimonas_sp.AAC.1